MDSTDALAVLGDRIDRLEADLDRRLSILEGRIDRMAPTAPPPLSIPRPPAPPPPPTSQPPVTHGRSSSLQTHQPPPPSRHHQPPPPGKSPNPPPPPTGRPAPFPSFDVTIEAALRWAGIALVALAAIFLVSTSIRRGWIGPELQLLGATFIGIALTVVADRLPSGRRPWALALANGGAVVVGVCAVAAHQWLGLIGADAGLAVVAAALAWSLLASVRLDMASVAATASTIALFSPSLMGASPQPLIVTPALVAAIGAGIGLWRDWPTLRLVSVWGALAFTLAQSAVASGSDGLASVGVGLTITALGMLAALAWSIPIAAAVPESGRPPTPAAVTPVDRWRRLMILAERTLVAAAPAAVWGSAAMLLSLDGDRSGVVAVAIGACGLVVVVIAAVWSRRHTGAEALQTVIVAQLVGAGLVTAIGLVQLLRGDALAVALAVQAVVTLAVASSSRLVPGRDRDGGGVDSVWPLQLKAYLLMGTAGLAAGDGLTESIGAAAVEPGGLMAHGVVVAAALVFSALAKRHLPKQVAEATLAAAWLLLYAWVAAAVSPFGDGSSSTILLTSFAAVSLLVGRRLGVGVIVTGGVLGAAAVALGLAGTAAALDAVAEPTRSGMIAHLLDQVPNLVPLLGTWALVLALWRRPFETGREHLTLALVAVWAWSLMLIAAAMGPMAQGQFAISMIWAMAGMAALVTGIRLDDRPVRNIGLGTLVLVVAKLLTVDLDAVDTLWRVGLFLVVGLCLLRLGYVLPRLVERYGPDEAHAEGG